MAGDTTTSGATAPPGPLAGSRARSRLVRELIWRRVDVAGIEYFRLWESVAGPRLTGTVILVDAGAPVRLKYAVACSPDWTSRGVHIALTRGAATRHVKITAGPDQRWWQSVEEVPRQDRPHAASRPVEIPGVAGCFDLDLAFTPATNLLPLRRLALAPGESGDLTAAWIRFPGLAIEPLPQRYTRLDERRIRYESRGGAFSAEIEIDDLGLPVSYPPLWERAATTEPPPEA